MTVTFGLKENNVLSSARLLLFAIRYVSNVYLTPRKKKS